MDNADSSGAENFWLETPAGVILAVKAQPGSRRPKIGPVVTAAALPGWPTRRLKIAVAVAPEDGKANAAILQALADWLGVKPAALVHEAGMTARDKKFLVKGSRAVDFSDKFTKLTTST